MSNKKKALIIGISSLILILVIAIVVFINFNKKKESESSNQVKNVSFEILDDTYYLYDLEKIDEALNAKEKTLVIKVKNTSDDVFVIGNGGKYDKTLIIDTNTIEFENSSLWDGIVLQKVKDKFIQKNANQPLITLLGEDINLVFSDNNGEEQLAIDMVKSSTNRGIVKYISENDKSNIIIDENKTADQTSSVKPQSNVDNQIKAVFLNQTGNYEVKRVNEKANDFVVNITGNGEIVPNMEVNTPDVDVVVYTKVEANINAEANFVLDAGSDKSIVNILFTSKDYAIVEKVDGAIVTKQKDGTETNPNSGSSSHKKSKITNFEFGDVEETTAADLKAYFGNSSNNVFVMTTDMNITVSGTLQADKTIYMTGHKLVITGSLDLNGKILEIGETQGTTGGYANLSGITVGGTSGKVRLRSNANGSLPTNYTSNYFCSSGKGVGVFGTSLNPCTCDDKTLLNYLRTGTEGEDNGCVSGLQKDTTVNVGSISIGKRREVKLNGHKLTFIGTITFTASDLHNTPLMITGNGTFDTKALTIIYAGKTDAAYPMIDASEVTYDGVVSSSTDSSIVKCGSHGCHYDYYTPDPIP